MIKLPFILFRLITISSALYAPTLRGSALTN